MFDKPRWEVEGRGWPHAEHSRFVEAGGVRWHVQTWGEGPVALLLHGAGAATHSWRGLAPALARRFTIVAPDLPGHGFSSTPRGPLSLDRMAAQMQALLKALNLQVDLVVGHSAGAALGLRLALDHPPPAAVVAINGALRPFAGPFAPVARGLALGLFANPLAVAAFAHGARDMRRVERLIGGMGSRLDAEGLDLYRRLFRTRGHVAATLGMMGAWDVEPLLRDLPGLKSRLMLIVGARDTAVPPEVSRDVASSVPGADLVVLEGLGHLAHEEAPERVGQVVLERAQMLGLIEGGSS
ncbi:MAG: alpha/beta fold hydrolase [Caulobacteraceae bacterium]|nr:alpha/beta fold hydrolase [Caulobacteraceae bacterium]